VRLNYGSLYAVVESLDKRGMIRVREIVREGRRPERTVYEITEAGAREAADWLTDLLSLRNKEFPTFMAALSFIAALPPDEALQALRHRIRGLELDLLKLQGMERAAVDMGLPRLFALEGEYEAALLQAELDFVRKLVDEIESGSLDGLQLWRAFFADEQTRTRVLADLSHQFAPLPKELP
jgi:DNA-binding PadR family transcriptional regulator